MQNFVYTTTGTQAVTLAKKPDAKTTGKTDTATIAGGKRPKRAPRLKDSLQTALTRTRAQAEMEYYKRAEERALNPMRPRRDQLIALYQQITKDNYLTGQITTLKNKVLSEGFAIVDKSGKENSLVLELFERPWFTDFLSRVLDTDFYGHTLINFDYPNEDGEFHRFDLIPRGQVVPEFGMVLLRPTDDVGIPFRGIDADYTKLLIEVRLFDEEGKDHLGILLKAAPEVIWKRYSRVDMSRRSEKYGMPMLALKTSAVEESELEAREKGLSNMGANGWIVIDESESLDVKESSNTDGSKIYTALSGMCNDEIAYLITGQTATSQETGSRAGGEVHERVQEHYIQARMRFLSQYVNYELWPFLKKWGYPLDGLQFKWRKWIDEAAAKQAALNAPKPPTTDPEKDTPPPPNAQGKKKSLKMADMFALFELAASKADVAEATKWLQKAIKLHEKHMDGTAPTTGKEGEKSQMEMMEQMKKAYAALTGEQENTKGQANQKASKKGMGSMKMAQPNFSVAGALTTPATTDTITLAAADTNLLKLFNDVLKKLHTDKPTVKKMLKSPEFLAMYRATAAQLSEGLENGYGQKIAAVKWNSPDAVLLGKLTTSLYVFSANKDYQLLTELNELLVVEGQVRSYASFESEALKLHQDYNVNWLRTEYDTAVATGQMAAKWPGFQEDKDKYFLKYTTANDDRVRPTHKELDGILLPVDDSFWNTHYPPLGWHCRCNVVRVPRAGRTPSTKEDVAGLSIKATEFGHNAPKTGVVFPDSHQYNNVPAEEKRILRRTAEADTPKPTKKAD